MWEVNDKKHHSAFTGVAVLAWGLHAHFYAVIVQLAYLIIIGYLKGQCQRMFDTYEHGYNKFGKVYIFVFRYSIARYQFCVSASSTVARTRILVVGNLLFSNVNSRTKFKDQCTYSTTNI